MFVPCECTLSMGTERNLPMNICARTCMSECIFAFVPPTTVWQPLLVSLTYLNWSLQQNKLQNDALAQSQSSNWNK